MICNSANTLPFIPSFYEFIISEEVIYCAVFALTWHAIFCTAVVSCKARNAHINKQKDHSLTSLPIIKAKFDH